MRRIHDTYRLQAFDVFSSFWFTAIYALLFISLVGCLTPRLHSAAVACFGHLFVLVRRNDSQPWREAAAIMHFASGVRVSTLRDASLLRVRLVGSLIALTH